MTPEAFRRLALSLPDAIEMEHMDHPDFRVGGKIFATLGYPDETRGMVKLMPDQQQDYIRLDSAAFTPLPANGEKRAAPTSFSEQQKPNCSAKLSAPHGEMRSSLHRKEKRNRSPIRNAPGLRRKREKYFQENSVSADRPTF